MSKGNSKRNSKGRNNKPNSKGSKANTKGSTTEASEDPKGYANPPEDYIPNPALMSQVGGFSFNQTIGVNPMVEITFPDAASIHSSFNVGNILELQLFPSIGRPNVGLHKSAINAAMLKIYNKISADNGKTTYYLPEDIGFAVMATGEVISLASNYCRAYGYAFNFNPRNRTVPREVIAAMGFSPDDFIKHLAEGRLRYNALMTKASNIRILDDFAYMRKCWRIYEDVFYDKGSAMGQLYVNRPAGYLRFNEGSYDEETHRFIGSTLRWNPFTSLLTVEAYLDKLEACINAILTSSTFNYVFSDIMRYVTRQGGQLFKFEYLPENYAVVPRFSETYLTQVHNATWGLFNLDDYEITDEVSTLSLRANYSPVLDPTNNATYGLLGDTILDFPYTDMPTPGDIVDALVYKQMGDLMNKEGQLAGHVGDFAMTDHPVYKVRNHMEGPNTTTYDFPNSFSDLETIGNYFITYDTYDVKPLLYYSDGNNKVPIGNLNYFTIVPTKQFVNIADYMMLGLFDVETRQVQMLPAK